jgi:hypothetical protein
MEFGSQKRNGDHGDANEAQNECDSVQKCSSDDEVFSHERVEFDLNSWRRDLQFARILVKLERYVILVFLSSRKAVFRSSI